MWLAVYKPKRFSISWLTNWVRTNIHPLFLFLHFLCYKPTSLSPYFLYAPYFQFCIVVGVLLLVLAPIGGLRQIIMTAKTYKFYQ